MPEMEKGRPPENKRSRKPAHPVKREINQEMKTFAESTMNELLGWYGYDKVELRDTEATEIRNYPNRERRQQHVSVLKENSVPKPKSLNSKVSPSALAMKSGERESSTFSSSPSSSSLTSPKEHKSAPVIVPLIKPSAVEDVQNVQIVCVWCQKEGVKRYSLCMGTELKSFCSEKCFAACRRAYFKRNKAHCFTLYSDTRSSAPPSCGHHQNQCPLSNPFLSQSVGHQGDWPHPSSDHEVPIKEAVQWGKQPKMWTSSTFTASSDFRRAEIPPSLTTAILHEPIRAHCSILVSGSNTRRWATRLQSSALCGLLRWSLNLISFLGKRFVFSAQLHTKSHIVPLPHIPR